MDALSSWHLLIFASMALIVIGVIVAVGRLAIGRSHSGTAGLHAELIRINQRLSAIENTLKDIDSD